MVLVGPRAEAERALPTHRLDGIVDEVGPYLVELARVSVDGGHVSAVAAHNGDPIAKLVAEHHKGALQTFGDVDVLHGRAIHLRIGLDGADERRDSPA